MTTLYLILTFFVFFFNDTATTEIYTLSLHDALPISGARLRVGLSALTMAEWFRDATGKDTLLFIDNIFRFSQAGAEVRSEEHTSELQSQSNIVCRLLLEKKKSTTETIHTSRTLNAIT